MASRSAIINVMARAAEKAARGLIRDFGEVEHLQVSRKGPADFVSTADTKAEQILKAELQKARPDFGFLLEEGGGFTGKDAGTRWIVDPLDGTTNYAHGLRMFSVSVGYERDGELAAGAVYDPSQDEMFQATVGGGATVNGQPLSVSTVDTLIRGLLATGFPYDPDQRPMALRQFSSLSMQAQAVRRVGSAALDCCWVAAGADGSVRVVSQTTDFTVQP
jgi:myo-inositol-1(or 4)-monophosphatase